MPRRLIQASIFGICFFLPCLTIEFPLEPYALSITYLLTGIVSIFYIAIFKAPNTIACNCMMVVASICVATFLCDLLARPVLALRLRYRPDTIAFCRPQDPLFHWWPREPTLYRYYPSESFETRISGNLAAQSGNLDHREIRQVRFTTDAFGFRNDPDASAKLIDTIVLGDSFGMGEGTTQDKIWSHLVELQCRRTTYNLSIPGSLRNQLVNLKIEYPRLHISRDAVVLWCIFSGNKLTDHYYDALGPDFAGPLGMAHTMLFNFRKQSPVKKLYESATGMHASKVVVADCLNKEILFYQPDIDMRNMTLHQILGHENLPRIKAVFAEMKRFAQQKKLRVHVILFPSKPEIYWSCIAPDRKAGLELEAGPSPFGKVVEEISATNGFPYLDLTPDLLHAARKAYKDSGELLWWRDDTHMNEKGNEVVASLICEKVFKTRPKRKRDFVGQGK